MGVAKNEAPANGSNATKTMVVIAIAMRLGRFALSQMPAPQSRRFKLFLIFIIYALVV